MLDQLVGLGLVVDTQTAVAHRRFGNVVQGALARSVMARLPGAASSGAVLLVSHYDAAVLSPGAGDDGIGVATVLETARALTSGPAPRNDVIFLVTDAEEWGMLGARAFAARHPWMDDVAVVLNFEARGTTGPALMFETGPASGWAIEAYAREALRPVSSSLFPEAYRRLPNDTDFSVFGSRGLPGLNFALGASAHWYHTPGDAPEHLSRASLYHMGASGHAVTRELAELDLADRASPEPVYFHVPGFGLVTYATVLAIPLALLLIAVFVVVTLYARLHGRLSWAGLTIGLLAGVVAVAVSGALAYLVWTAVRDVHPEYGDLAGRALHREWPYVTAFVAIAAASVLGVFGVLRRWFPVETLSLGALVAPIVLAALAAFLLPAASYLFLWPSFAALAMVALVVRSPYSGELGMASVAALVVLGAAITALLAPHVYLLHVFMGVAIAPVLTGVAGLFLLLLVPLLEVLGTPNRVWLPASAAGLAGALVVFGLTTAEATPERPAPANLVHVQDQERDSAVWAVPVSHDNEFTNRFVGDAADTIGLGLYSLRTRGRYRVATAPTWQAPRPDVTVASEEVRDGRRVVWVRLAWAELPRLVEVWPDTGIDTELLGPLPADGDDTEASPPSGQWRVVRSGLSEPLELAIAGPAGEPIRLVTTTHYPGLPALPGGPDVSRPPGLMATPAAGGRGTLSDARLVREVVSF